MAMNLKEARAMLAAAKAHPDKVTMLCPPPNAMKHGKHFGTLLKTGKIGRPTSFQFNSFTGVWTDQTAPAHWRQLKAFSGNNIMSVGIYAEVLGRWFGLPECLCAQGRVVSSQRGTQIVDVPDIVQVLGEWPGNIHGSLYWTGISFDAPTDKLRVFGTEGELTYDFGTNQISLVLSGKLPEIIEVDETLVDTWQVEADFINAIRKGGQPEPSFQTGVDYMKFVEAVSVSMSLHQWVQLESL